MGLITLYHGSKQVAIFPFIQNTIYNKDFGDGYYCTQERRNAERWAGRGGSQGWVFSYYMYREQAMKLNFKSFDGFSNDWLDFIVYCRSGGQHDYDIVEGAEIVGKIGVLVNDYTRGTISREEFQAFTVLEKYSTQMCFTTRKALKLLHRKEMKSYVPL